jgi:hypothetical protein
MIGLQLHLSTVPNLVPVPDPFPIEAGDIKPRWAFWTSTYTDGSSGWVDWCRAEEFGDPDAANWFVLEAASSARIYTVDTLADLEQLVDRYPLHPFPYLPKTRYVDWAAMAKDWHGLRLTEEGQWATRLTEPGLYGWDCECTAWFRWSFTAITKLARSVEPVLKRTV